MKQIEAQIMGQTYVLSCPEEAEGQMQQSVQRVDAAMCKIRDAGKIRARDRIAVLAALNLAFDLVEREQQGGFNGSSGTADAAAVQAVQSPTDALLHPRMQALLQRMEDLLAEDGKLL
ncbi:MAG: cell division protein ZapA [Brachymonas sp.]|nr:cell division protein ZapA [Brachymonas sp.]